MRVLGIDPGLQKLGYAILEKRNDQFHILSYSFFSSKKGYPLSQKLYLIHKKIASLLEEYQPDTIAIEKIIYKHIQSTLILSKVQGVLMLTSEAYNTHIYEYTPLEIKKSITGYGNANKESIQKMISLLFSIKEYDIPFDVFDAISVGVCHLLKSSIQGFTEKKNFL